MPFINTFHDNGYMMMFFKKKFIKKEGKLNKYENGFKLLV